MGRPIRLCHFITDSVIIGGAETFLVELTRHLPAEYEQMVVCLTGEGPLLERLHRNGIQAVSLHMNGKTDIRAVVRLVKLLRNFRPDVLHTHLFHATFLGALVGRLLRIPMVISTEHTAGLRGVRALCARVWTSLNDRAVAVSGAVRDVLVAAGIASSKVDVIVNGLNLEPYQAPGNRAAIRREFGIPDGAPVIGMVAGFRPVKGHEFLVRAFAHLTPVCPEAWLLLVGEGPMRVPTEELVKELGIADRVRFAGFRTDIASCLSAMDVFALSSLWEGMPLCLLEAMAAGLPVVASDVSGIPEVVVEGETGLLVPVGDPGQLADALGELLQDRRRCSEMGEAAKGRVQQMFNIRSTAGAYHRLYQTLLEGRD